MTGGSLLATRYELTEPLGRGGMGEVWAARDTALGNRNIAVKLLSAQRLASLSGTADPEELRRRFLRESRVTARIDHPGLVAVHDAGQDGDQLYLVMQLVEGSDLADHLAEHDPYPWPWAAAVLAQLCSALAAVHAHRIVHRDLKPGNIMIRPDGRATILDLGIAAVREDEDTRLTHTGTLLGTPVYMAPEQALGGSPIGPAADLYALGTIGYQLLAGRPPFDAPNAPGLLYKKLHEQPEPLQRLRPDAPASLTALIHQLLHNDPQQRPADARQVFDALIPHLPPPGTPGATLPMDPTRPFRHPMAPWPAAQPTHPAPRETELTAALEQVKQLLALGHYAQVAELLNRTLPLAATRYGADSTVVRSLRKQYATVLLDLGDYARALPEIQWLVQEFTAERGPYDPVVLQLRADEQLCLSRLGHR